MIRAKILGVCCISFAVVSIVLAGGPPTIDITEFDAPENANRIDSKAKISANGATLQAYKIYLIPVAGGPGGTPGGPGDVRDVPKPNAAKGLEVDFKKLKAGKYTCIFEVQYNPFANSYSSISKRPADANVTGPGGFMGNRI
jgi:hypothetical protein